RRTSLSGVSSEWARASTTRREASVMNSPYNFSRSRSRACVSSRAACVRWVIQVVRTEVTPPAREPPAAAKADMTYASIGGPPTGQREPVARPLRPPGGHGSRGPPRLGQPLGARTPIGVLLSPLDRQSAPVVVEEAPGGATTGAGQQSQLPVAGVA